MLTGEMRNIKETLGNTLVKVGKKDKRIVCLEADLMRASGTKIFEDEFPDRHYQVGIAEQDLLGTAAGLAAMGKIPFAATFANFVSQRGCDQAVNSVAYNKFNVKILGTYAGLSSEKNGGTHISIEDMAIFRSMPNMIVINPGDCVELEQAIIAASEYDGPVYLRVVRGPMETFFDKDYKFEIGKAVTLEEGNDVALITTGITTKEGIMACEELKKEGIKVKHIHMPTIKPIDKEAIIKAAKETEMIITVENHSVMGGLGSAVAETVCEEYPVKVKRLGILDKFGETAKLDWLMEKYGIDKKAIIKAVKSNLSI